MLMVETSAFVQVPTTPEVFSFSSKETRESPWALGFGVNERTITANKRQTNYAATRLFAADDNNESVEAMTAYMAKTHEEKLETQKQMAVKDAEIEVRLS
jgi:hypothetical protein